MLPLRSVSDTESAYVQFQNKTNRKLDVLWINYIGTLEKYGTLQPNGTINVDTFKTHPWIFVDPKTGIKMRVGFGHGTIFYPSSNTEVVRALRANPSRLIRVPVPVRLPLFSLQQISLQNVLLLLKDISDIENLQLPIILKKEIIKLNREKNDMLSKY